jgi:hypothetical protein
MVDLDGIFVHFQINGFLADEAVSLLCAVQFIDQLVSVFRLLAGEEKRTHGYGYPGWRRLAASGYSQYATQAMKAIASLGRVVPGIR